VRPASRLARLRSHLPLPAAWPERVDLDGIAVPIRRSPLAAAARRQVMKGYYETAERDLVAQFVGAGDHVLELGASVGVLTCFLARRAGAGGRVVSVEANAALRSAFEAQLASNALAAEFVPALCCPVWESAVPASVAALAFQPAPDSLAGRARPAAPAGQPAASWTTAGAICQARALRPSAVVVDVEGAEGVWAELPPRLPESVTTVIAEFHPAILGARGAGAAVQAIIDEGFRIAALRGTVLAFRRPPR
jgi:FkbM family methyltransferase